MTWAGGRKSRDSELLAVPKTVKGKNQIRN
jgi:hypothetical protein